MKCLCVQQQPSPLQSWQPPWLCVCMCACLSVSLCNTPFPMGRAPEWLFLASKSPKKQGPGERLRTRGQSGEGSAARHREWLPASEPRCPFHLPAATSGTSNDRVNMQTVLASCSISHYDPIFWINCLRTPTIFWNKTTHYSHIPYAYPFPQWGQCTNKPWSTGKRWKQAGNQDFYCMINEIVAQQSVLKEISVPDSSLIRYTPP